MATLKLTYRTNKKDAEYVVLRARFNLDAKKAIYGTTPTLIDVKQWNLKKEELNLETRPKEILSGLSIQEQNKIIEGVNSINEKRSETNKVINGLKDFIIQAFNAYSDEYTSAWLQGAIDEYYASFNPKIEQKPIDLNLFIEQYIEELQTGKRLKKRANKKVSEGTIKSIKGFQSQFLNYQNDRHKIINFDDVTMDFYRDFMDYLLFTRKYSANTVARMVKVLKTVMYAAKDLKLHNNREFENKDFSVNYEEVDNVYLSEERIDILYNMDLSDHLAWEKVRDVFIVGCLTGQRVSDYKRINASMITKLYNGLDYIEIRQEKTDKTVYVPLDWRVKEILNKYNGTLPQTYDQKINDYIKKICEKAEFTEIVKITQNKAGMEATISKRFCDMVKTHTARRSLCTNMQKAGCKLSEIIAISGHESEEQLKTYLKLTDQERAVIADTGYVKRVQMKVG